MERYYVVAARSCTLVAQLGTMTAVPRPSFCLSSVASPSPPSDQKEQQPTIGDKLRSLHLFTPVFAGSQADPYVTACLPRQLPVLAGTPLGLPVPEPCMRHRMKRRSRCRCSLLPATTTTTTTTPSPRLSGFAATPGLFATVFVKKQKGTRKVQGRATHIREGSLQCKMPYPYRLHESIVRGAVPGSGGWPPDLSCPSSGPSSPGGRQRVFASTPHQKRLGPGLTEDHGGSGRRAGVGLVIRP